MEKAPKFIKEFTKEKSLDERRQTAQRIRAKRAEHFSNKDVQTKEQKELQRATEERAAILAEQLKAIDNLKEEIARLSSSAFKKVSNFLKLRKLQADMQVGEQTYTQLAQSQEIDTQRKDKISVELDSKAVPPEFEEARNILRRFYEKQEEEWIRSEYSKEDMTKYFSDEHLATLSLQEYALLLKRFPSEMVAHVTRQGVRDHTGHFYHTAGEGEYGDSFIRIIEDGRLRSPLGVHLIEEEKEKAIAQFLQLKEAKNKEEALADFEALSTVKQGGSGSYADRMAIHFATEEVADAFYGSERGNEIFIAYPSAYVASQYYFNGQLNKAGGGYWNDQWVWANEERGMDLNAGLVFIPKEARVSRKTGSRYELNADKKPKKNVAGHAAIQKVVASPDFRAFAEEALEISGKLSADWDSENLDSRNMEILKKLDPFRRKLEQEFGITDPRLQFAVLRYSTLLDLDIHKRLMAEGKPDEQHAIDLIIEGALQDEGVQYEEANDTISSEEFWEEYFTKHPSKRPTKIVYYKGIDPTLALRRWKDENYVYKRTSDENMGFPERQVKRTSTEANKGNARFETLGRKVIEKYFEDKEVAQHA